MKQKEKRILRRSLIAFLVIIAIYVVVQLLESKAMGNEFKDYLFSWEWQQDLNALEPEQLQFEFGEEGMIRLGEVTKEDGKIVYRLYPEKAGTTSMTVVNKENGEEVLLSKYRVSRTGVITDYMTGNFTNYRMYHLNIVLLCAALTILLWFSFVWTQRELVYSYQSIFYSGLALWMTLVTLLQIKVWVVEDVMFDVYGVLQSAAGVFMLYTFVPLLIFCIALTLSNISLIRHEGFRFVNALGIMLSFIMIIGALACFAMDYLFVSGTIMEMKIFDACISIFYSIYAFMECFLIGSILCGTLAARQEPKCDMDYLIILGCMIKEDGTLYPLIRGRVDRAIAFYKKQLEENGKKAVFVPSGGKGSDEPISEAEAMKRYLLEQGIPEEQIMVEDQSKNMLQNMRFSKKLIEERNPEAKTAFSTTNFHVFRSGIIARQNDFEPYGMGSPTKWYFWSNAYMREVIGMVAYKWKSIIIVLVPIIAFLIAIQFVGM